MARKQICGIYCIENKINGKKYIGQSIHIYQRWNAHKSELNNNKHSNVHLQNSWNKYGDNNFRFYIVKECKLDCLDFYEKYYIDKYDSYKTGYNRDLGGKSYPEEFGHKISASKINISDEDKVLNRKKNIQSHADECIPICQLDRNGNLISEWVSIRDAARELCYCFSPIWHCVKHKRKTYKNYIWVSKQEYESKDFNLNNYIAVTNPKPKRIIQLDLRGNEIKVWDSIRQIQRELKFKSDGIIDCCKHRKEIFRGYKWSYFNDYINYTDGKIVELVADN